MEKSTESSENAITNIGKTPIAVESAVFILFSDTMRALAFQEWKSTETIINGITRQRRDAATQHVWIVKILLQCPRGNISACRAHSVTTALSCELTANTMINMTAPDLEKLIPTSMPQVEDIQLWMKRKALEVILELHVWIDANDVGTTRWIVKGDVNQKKVCLVVAVMSTTTEIITETEIITDTETSTATEITTDTETFTETTMSTDTAISTATTSTDTTTSSDKEISTAIQ